MCIKNTLQTFCGVSGSCKSDIHFLKCCEMFRLVVRMKGKGKGDRTSRHHEECPLKFPSLKTVDHVRLCPRYSAGEAFACYCLCVCMSCWCHLTCIKYIIIIPRTMFIVLSSWQSHFESSLGSADECGSAPVGCQLSDQASLLGPWVYL